MITIFTRTIIIYLILVIIMRVLGKRQLGELEVSELITTILISEIAAMPISNQDIPISYAIIPLILIMTFEVTSSFLICKFPVIKNFFADAPSLLIYKGRINQKELLKNRISPEELLSELRLKSITDPIQVEYAILEHNGMLSVIPKLEYQQLTLDIASNPQTDNGIVHIVISQGAWNEYNINRFSINKEEIEKYLQRKKLDIKEVFLLTLDDSGNKTLIRKDNKK